MGGGFSAVKVTKKHGFVLGHEGKKKLLPPKPKVVLWVKGAWLKHSF